MTSTYKKQLSDTYFPLGGGEEPNKTNNGL